MSEALKNLPALDTDAQTSERVRRLALSDFGGARGWWKTPLRLATPVFLAGTVGIYLIWAFNAAASVYN